MDPEIIQMMELVGIGIKRIISSLRRWRKAGMCSTEYMGETHMKFRVTEVLMTESFSELAFGELVFRKLAFGKLTTNCRSDL